MRAMVLQKPKKPLILCDLREPDPGPHEVLIRVDCCGVCRTDVHIADGELTKPKLPLIMGHQVIGTVEKLGAKAEKYEVGQMVGAAWLGKCCMACEYCLSGKENLCDNASFMGYTQDGGYAEFCTAHEEFIYPVPTEYTSIQAAPLYCAGLIGYRTFRLAGMPKRVGLYGFGSSAHLLIQVAKSLGTECYVFTRHGDMKTQAFAKSLGAVWAGSSNEPSPKPLDAGLIFAPVGELIPKALLDVKKGGKVISAGIHMSDIPSFPYAYLWQERSISSVANLTRQDAYDFLEHASNIPLKASVTVFPLEQANQALDAIRTGSAEGSVILKVS